MKSLVFIWVLFAGCITYAQDRVNPVIKSFGSIYDIPEATVKADPDQEYKIVIDVVTGAEDQDELAWGLNNVARMLNLHAVSGANMNKMDVVLAIHGSATYAVMNNKLFKKRFGIENPNLPLMKELSEAGVKLTVCGQSLKSRNVPMEQVAEEVEIATSMLTTVTTYQLKGYALLKF